VKQIQGFLGLTNFYHHFVNKFFHIAWPLTELTKKEEVWSWDLIQQQAFDELKQTLITSQYYVPQKSTHTEHDTSNYTLVWYITTKTK
jgi:hypothetical protein